MGTVQASRFGPKSRDEAPVQDVADPLLAFLRASTANETLTYAEAPARITGGFDTAIWVFRLAGAEDGLSGRLILRVFRGDTGRIQARYEAIAQNAVADQGYPAPRVLLSCEDMSLLGGSFTVMPRVRGKVMLERVFGPAMLSVPVQLAELQARLHSLDPDPVRRVLASADLPPKLVGEGQRELWAPLIATSNLGGLQDAAAWIDDHRPPPPPSASICHGDFHPLNVMMDGKEVTGVIDWSSMRVTDPAWDVGAALALFGHGPVDLPGPVIPLVNLARNRLKARYLRTYRSRRPLEMRSIEYYEAMRLLGFMGEVGEYRRARAGALAPNDKPTAFNNERVLSGIIRRFAEITGVTPSLPPDPIDP